MDCNVLPAREEVKQSTSRPPTQPRSSTDTSSLPHVTFPTDEASLQRAAEVISAANVTDPLNTLFSLEEHAASISNNDPSNTPASQPDTSSASPTLYSARSLRRLRSKLAAGCVLAESASFAAVAIYEPPAAVARLAALPPPTSTGPAQLPLLTSFLDSIHELKSSTLPEGRPYYKMTMMARSPSRSDKGAVRVLIEGLIKRAEIEGAPVWCEAGNERARDVYAYFGFVVVGLMKTGEGLVDELGKVVGHGTMEDERPVPRKAEGVKTWGMVHWPTGGGA